MNKVIDYVKLVIKDIDIDRLVNHQKLDFISDLNESTGENSKKKKAIYHHCTITIYETGIVLFRGSIHKMFNSIMNIYPPSYINQSREVLLYKGYNGNLLTLDNITFIRLHLENLFKCNSSQMLFQNIEIGVNTLPGFCPREFIKGLLYHHAKEFEFKYDGNYAQAVHDRYLLKIYNKSKQYGLPEHTLRVELKIRKTEHLTPTGIRSFADINTITLENAKILLLKTFDNVVYYDYTIRKEALNDLNRERIKEYSSPRFWLQELMPNRRSRPKAKLAEIIFNHSENLHSIVRKEIMRMCVIINRPINDPNCVIIHSSSIGLNITQNSTRICPITGIDISMQKDDSNLLSNTGLRHLRENEPSLFKKLIEVFITGKDNKFERDIYSRLSKQIRNRFYNQRDLFVINQKKLFLN